MKEMRHYSPDEVIRQGGGFNHRLDFIVTEKIVGMADLIYKNAPFPFYYIALMRIENNMRGLGHGRDFLVAVNRFLDLKGKCGILANAINVESPVHAMYRNHGWREVENNPFWYVYNPPNNLTLGRIAKAIYGIEHM